jgi:hypothetical protein
MKVYVVIGNWGYTGIDEEEFFVFLEKSEAEVKQLELKNDGNKKYEYVTIHEKEIGKSESVENTELGVHRFVSPFDNL